MIQEDFIMAGIIMVLFIVGVVCFISAASKEQKFENDIKSTVRKHYNDSMNEAKKNGRW